MPLKVLAKAVIKKNSRVLVRIDSDVDVIRGTIARESAYRLDCALPTLKYLLQKKAIITVMGHRGRPAGKKVVSLSLAPVQKYFETKLRRQLHFLPNVRFDAREEINDIAYARELADGQDIFINESFATAHRAHASTEAITHVLPSYAGIQFEREVRELSRLTRAQRPLSVIIGGAKIETKVPVIAQFVDRAAHIFIVGAAANAFFAARGMCIGASVVSEESVRAARALLKHKNIFIPVDVMVGGARGAFRAFALPDDGVHIGFEICTAQEKILDIGPATLVMMSELLTGSRTMLWNGPAGVFEQKPFHLGTERIARMLSKYGRSGAHVVAGGGETVTSILQNKMTRGFTHISTGGGAMLEFLSGKKLPVVVSLYKK